MAKKEKPIESPSVRFWRKVQKTEYCWNWIGARTKKNYGAFSIRKKSVLAHRFSYEEKNGNITAKLLDHLCRNTLCVNPTHLQVVSLAENVRRGALAKLNQEKVLQIRRIYEKGELPQWKIGALFGVRQDEVSRIVNNLRWSNI